METKDGQRQALAPTSASSLEVHLGYWLRKVSNHVSGAFTRALQEQHTSAAEWVVLQHLQESNQQASNQQASNEQESNQMSPSELADALALTRGAISKVLDKLGRKGWIVRATQAGDNRGQRVSLTPQGRRILPRLAEIADRNDERFFACLDDTEQDDLRRLLRKLARCHQISHLPIE